MNKPGEFDVGPLTWVKNEIDQALDRSLTALHAFAADPGKSAQLKSARETFHQAHGALQIIGLDGVTRLAEELEALLDDISLTAGAPDAAKVAVIENAYKAIRGYLEDLLAGEANQPLKLYKVYQAVAGARAREADPIDLYYPDLSRRPPRREQAVVSVSAAEAPRFYRKQRARYQRGLLKWLRGSDSGLDDMRIAIAAVEAVQTSPAQRAFWWVALGFFDALAAQAITVQPAIQRLCNRIEQQLKRLVEGSTTVAERLMREALFVVARTNAVTDHVRQVREVYDLAATLPASLALKSDAEPQHPALAEAKDAIAAAKMAWNKSASGHRQSFATFGDHVAKLNSDAQQLQNKALSELTTELKALAVVLSANPERADDVVAMEVATSLLLVENAIDNFGKLEAEFGDQAEVMCQRLRACISGNPMALSAPIPLLDEMSRKAQERLTMKQVLAEILASLRTIEQALDEFFRDSTKRSGLKDLGRPVRQVLGAFTILGEERAVAVLSECFTDIQRFGQNNYDPVQSDFERVAATLSGLGFYVEALQHGKADLDEFMRPIGAPKEGQSEVASPNARTVEAEIEDAKRELEKQFETWRHNPEDEAVKRAFQAQLEGIQKDANLVADAALERRVGEMLGLMKGEDARPFDAEISQVMQNISPASAVAAPSPEAAKLLSASDETVDAELLSVYLEEAGEVLTTISEHNELLRGEPPNVDVMRTIRRGYHTLKGSGRMVGLTRLSEAAWAIEQVLNRWLEEERAATPDLLSLIEVGRAFFADAVTRLKAGGASPDEHPIIALSEKVRQGGSLSDADLEVNRGNVEAAVAAPAPAADSETSDVGGFSLDFTQPVDTLLPPLQSLDLPPLDDTLETITIGDVELSQSLYGVFVDEAQAIVAALRKAHAMALPGSLDDEFNRHLHTLTGIAGTARFMPICDLSEALEELMVRIGGIEPDETTRGAIGEALLCLEAMVRAIADMRAPETQPDVLARLALLPAGDNTDASHADAPELDFSAVESTSAPEPTAASDNVLSFPAPAAESPFADIEAEAVMEKRRRLRIEDDLDPQLLPIFLEEAQELVPAVGAGVRDWRDNPANSAAGQGLQRVLHTLKGSARMAGAMNIGELMHSMETRIENALGAGALPSNFFTELETSCDRLSLLHERLINADSTPLEDDEADMVDASVSVEAEAAAPQVAATPVAEAAPGAAAAPVTPAEADATAQQRAMLRVRADLIDRLVNQAGEVSISRSRIEGEMRNLKGAVHDLTENVARLRAQLREIEIQAESQMQSKMTLAQEQHQEFDPLEFDRFTRFQEVTRSMAESVNDVSTVHNNLLKTLDESDAALMAQARLTRELQGGLMRIRMVPFASVSERLYRIVRQAAKETQKRAVLDIRGSQVELDRSVLERMTAPFEHMLRNCVAHGIEEPQQRTSTGKAQIGEIKIEVRQEGNEIMLAVTDDGAGLNYERIRAKAESQGLLPEGADATPDELAQFIFHPGFSTANEITQLAGRGIGMDVVKSEIAALGGRIDIQSEAGKGSRFTVFLPLTTAVTQAVLIRAGGHIYAVPSVMVEQIRQLKADDLAACQAAGEVRWQDRPYQLRYLPRLLGDLDHQPEAQRLTPVMFTRSGNIIAAVQIDEVIGNQEIVVKNTGPLLARVIGITGATVLGNGQIVLILNPVVLSQHGRFESHTMTSVKTAIPGPALPTVMIVDDSLTVRKITGRLLAREGYVVLTAKDGVDAMEQLQEAHPDVMLVDIEMPRMDGFDLTRNVRNDARLKHIPIIMITSRTAEKHRNYAAQIGVNVYLGKPFQEDLLLEHIAGFVQRPVTV